MMQAATDASLSLREALALLGDWEHELQWLIMPSTPSFEKPKQRSKNATPLSTDYSRRRKIELAELQNHVTQLEQLLEVEQARIEQRLATTSTSALIKEYKEMVIRQKCQRVSAVTENQKLRDLLAKHQNTRRRVAKLTRKALMLTELEGLVTDTVTTLANYSGPIISISQHLQYLDYRMDEARMLLSSDVFVESSGRDFRHVTIRDLGFAGLQVEVTFSWTVPFSADAVARVLWPQLTHSGHDGRSTNLQPDHESSDLLCTTFVSEPMLNDESTCNHGQMILGTTHGMTAARNYGIASDGSRILVAHIAAGIFDDDGHLKGELQGNGWFQVEPLVSRGSGSTSHAARVKMCRRVTGRPRNLDVMNRQERAEWVHSVVVGPLRSHCEKNVSRTLQDLENRLVLLDKSSSVAFMAE